MDSENKDQQGEIVRSSSEGDLSTLSLQNRFSLTDIINLRRGSVLIKKTILKSDHFPGCQNEKLSPHIEGAPNFRQVENIPIYGVAVPTVYGFRQVLNKIGGASGQRKVVWHNLREEPLIYINGKPFVVREADNPFANLEYTGINRNRVEDMEYRLKQDILSEAQKYDNQILVSHEGDDFQIHNVFEPVTEQDVQTPLEVFAELIDDQYDIDYIRIPITDEKAPKEKDFAIIIHRCWAQNPEVALVFNCQMGRGRTTTGMIIAGLLYLRYQQAFPLPKTSLPELSRRSKKMSTFIDGGQQDQDLSNLETLTPPGVPEWFYKGVIRHFHSNQATNPEDYNSEDQLLEGNFRVIRSLVRVLDYGHESKSVLDTTVDACSKMQNLREAITIYRDRIREQTKDEKKQSLLAVCQQYLERYFMLVAFTNYLYQPEFGTNRIDTFDRWIQKRNEMKSILWQGLKVDPIGGLELYRKYGITRQDSDMEFNKVVVNQQKQEEEEQKIVTQLIASRKGEVLGPFTILKKDFFPGMVSYKIPVQIQGAPNFRGLNNYGIPVYGLGIPTVQGIKEILNLVGAGNAVENKKYAVWQNIREEPVIYIHDVPYVLREYPRIFKNMLEYTGIDESRLEDMERRLKIDILNEAQENGGNLWVLQETSQDIQKEVLRSFTDTQNSSPRAQVHQRSNIVLTNVQVQIENPEDVKTPQEVYKNLKEQGFNVSYFRVPITDGKAPQFIDIQSIITNIISSRRHVSDLKDLQMIFNCQLGMGRTTIGMVMASILYLRIQHGQNYFQQEFSRFSETENEIMFQLQKNQELSISQQEDSLMGTSPRQYDKDFEDAVYPQNLGHHESNTAHNVMEQFDSESLATSDGQYLAVRSLVRLFEKGVEVKTFLDQLIDVSDHLLNLRKIIARYRKPRLKFQFFRSEIQARHQAFKRGSAYLIRYCQLILIAAYLEESTDGEIYNNDSTIAPQNDKGTFFQWFKHNTDLRQTFEFIQTNPGQALLVAPPKSSAMQHTSMATRQLSEKELVTKSQETEILNQRRGATLSKKTILKSYHNPNLLDYKSVYNIEGILGLRKVKELPIYTIGNPSIQGIQNMMDTLQEQKGEGEAENSIMPMPKKIHFAIIDLREELVVNINGSSYVRREVEQPYKAWHHAGMEPGRIQKLEDLLSKDVTNEIIQWSGKILLHREVSIKTDQQQPLKSNRQSQPDMMQLQQDAISYLFDPKPDLDVVAFWQHVNMDSVSKPSAEENDVNSSMNNTANFMGKTHSFPRQESDNIDSQSQDLDSTNSVRLQEDNIRFSDNSGMQPVDSATLRAQRESEDDMVDINYGGTMHIKKFQGNTLKVQGDTDKFEALERPCTPLQGVEYLKQQGYSLTYKRIPQSRDRTPTAYDLSLIQKVVLQAQQASKERDEDLVYLCISRTAMGSSVRFVCSLLTTLENLQHDLKAFKPEKGQMNMSESHFHQMKKQSSQQGQYRFYQQIQNLKIVPSMQQESVEFKGVLNLCRVLPDGYASKEAVDQAIEQCIDIGDIRKDISQCMSIISNHFQHIGHRADKQSTGEIQKLDGAGLDSPQKRQIQEQQQQKKEQDEQDDIAQQLQIGLPARTIGIHYLKRYFFLICFRCYILQNLEILVDGYSKGNLLMFDKWWKERPELHHLINTLAFDID